MHVGAQEGLGALAEQEVMEGGVGQRGRGGLRGEWGSYQLEDSSTSGARYQRVAT